MRAFMVKWLQPHVANKAQPIPWKASDHEHPNLGNAGIDAVSPRIFDPDLSSVWCADARGRRVSTK
jgi:hypothetical protein